MLDRELLTRVIQFHQTIWPGTDVVTSYQDRIDKSYPRIVIVRVISERTVINVEVVRSLVGSHEVELEQEANAILAEVMPDG